MSRSSADAAMNEFLSTLIPLTGSALTSRVTVGDVLNVFFALGASRARRACAQRH
jgi:hypothetical protein